MRHRTAIALLVLSSCAFAQPLQFNAKVVGSPVTVLLSTDSGVAPDVLLTMQQEVERVVSTAGLRLEWQDLRNPRPEGYERVASMRLRGQCVATAPWPSGRRFLQSTDEPLGQTQVVDGRVLPIADILCDAVRKVIAVDLRAAPAANREALLGRALGRVMAHELYHVLLGTREHGREGLAKPAQSSSELLAVRASFADSDEHKLTAQRSADEEDQGIAASR